MAANGAALRWSAVLVLLVTLLGGLVWFVRAGDLMVLFAAFAVATTLLVLLAAGHVLLRKDLAGTQRLIWLLIVVFVNPGLPIGAGAYLLMGPERTRALFADVRVGGGAPPSAE